MRAIVAAPPFSMSFERIAWSVTIVIGLIAAALFFHSGFRGYGLLSVLLSVAASVNVVPNRSEPGRADADQPD